MKAFFEKFVKIEREISEKRGSLALFGLFLRDESPNRWDLVVAAPWFGSDVAKTIKFMFQQMRTRLRGEDLLLVSRIVVVNTSDPRVEAIQNEYDVEHGAVEVQASEFFENVHESGFHHYCEEGPFVGWNGTDAPGAPPRCLELINNE